MNPLVIDTDNALGSQSGDIDDGLALAYLMKSGAPIVHISATSGNINAQESFRNTVTLANIIGFRGSIVPELSAVHALTALSQPTRVLALGPLTHVAESLDSNISEIIWVGTNFFHRLPGLRPFDFNLSCDPDSARRVFESKIPMTLVPCDIARKLRLTEDRLTKIGGALGGYIRTHSRRWFRRAMRLKLSRSIPVWDLLAAHFALIPDHFTTQIVGVTLDGFRRLNISPNGKRVKIVTGFDADAIWSNFFHGVAG